tara:strand:+ start:6685 stop:7059 length:375 start_codon:yes stop_codon:yes gene_type:complete
MADELTTGHSLQVQNGSLKHSVTSNSQKWNQGTAMVHDEVKDIGTTEETLSWGDIAAATQGLCYIQNLDATNFVDFGPDSSGLVGAIRVPASKTVGPFLLKPSATYKAQADTASCKVRFVVYST